MIVSAWESFTDELAEARRAASESRFGDLATLSAQLERSASQLPPPPENNLPAIRQELADLSGVLTHIAVVHGAMNGLRADDYGPGAKSSSMGRKNLDQRA